MVTDLKISFIFTFFYVSRRKYSFRAIFDFRFLIDLHILGCPDHDMTISGKCLSVRLSVCMRQKFYGKCSSRINAQNFMKLYILSYTTINWCLSTFGENRSTGGAVITLFPEFSG